METGVRAGTQALRLLSLPITVHVLQALAEGSQSLIDLHRKAGSPPQTTMRGQLRTLAETGVVIRRRQNDFPGALDFELGPAGQDLTAVAVVLGRWLEGGPDESLQLGSSAAKSAIKALVEGWATNIVRALAATPLSLTELSGLINAVSYPSLERRLGAMRLAGQIERSSRHGRGTPYTVTNWLRRAIGPLGAAAHWERTYVPAETAMVKRLDAEAAFLLAIPLVRLPEGISGVCRLAVEVSDRQLAGVLVEVREGRVTSCVASVQGHSHAWVSGSAPAWLRAVIEQDSTGLETGGDGQLARSLLASLHRALFDAAQPRLGGGWSGAE
jgi:DNA-binding HxlR family transcriptional regulator